MDGGAIAGIVIGALVLSFVLLLIILQIIGRILVKMCLKKSPSQDSIKAGSITPELGTGSGNTTPELRTGSNGRTPYVEKTFLGEDVKPFPQEAKVFVDMVKGKDSCLSMGSNNYKLLNKHTKFSEKLENDIIDGPFRYLDGCERHEVKKNNQGQYPCIKDSKLKGMGRQGKDVKSHAKKIYDLPGIKKLESSLLNMIGFYYKNFDPMINHFYSTSVKDMDIRNASVSNGIYGIPETAHLSSAVDAVFHACKQLSSRYLKDFSCLRRCVYLMVDITTNKGECDDQYKEEVFKELLNIIEESVKSKLSNLAPNSSGNVLVDFYEKSMYYAHAVSGNSIRHHEPDNKDAVERFKQLNAREDVKFLSHKKEKYYDEEKGDWREDIIDLIEGRSNSYPKWNSGLSLNKNGVPGNLQDPKQKGIFPDAGFFLQF